MSDGEWDWVRQQAAKAGKSLSAFCRDKILRGNDIARVREP